MDARLREGRAMLASPASQSAARPIIVDNARRTDAERLLSWASAVSPGGGGDTAIRSPRFVLVGENFGGPDPAKPWARAVARIRVGPLCLFEAGQASLKRLWLRGGYPEAFAATSDTAASEWLETYAADLAGGKLAAWDMPREPLLVSGLLQAVAAGHGRVFNENAAARALGVSRPTIGRYLGILERAGLLFQLPALLPRPPKNRVTTSPALYIRDSGLLHALLGIRSADELALKPRLAAASWAGFVVGQAREVMPSSLALHRYASADGAALDLVVVRDGRPILVAAARRLGPVSVERSISYAASALLGRADPEQPQASRPGRYIVVPDGDERPLPGGFSVLGLGAFLERVAMADA